MKKIAVLTLLITIFYSGCSSKKYFEPSVDTISYQKKIYSSKSSIIAYNPKGATLEDKRFITKSGISKINLKDGFKFLNISDGTVISADDFGKVNLHGKGIDKTFNLKKKVISATLKDNILSAIFIDNSVVLYDIDKQQIKYQEYFSESVLNDIQIASPVFLDTIVLFPTLDGKIVLVDYHLFNKIKVINLDPRNQVHNIIYLDTIGDTLIAATDHRLFTFTNSKAYVKNFDIMHLVTKGKYIYLATLDGQLIKLNQKLHILRKRKFKFAKFVTIGAGDKYIYALDIQGYLVSVNKNLKNLLIFELPYDSDERVFSLGNKLYFEDKYIILD